MLVSSALTNDQIDKDLQLKKIFLMCKIISPFFLFFIFFFFLLADAQGIAQHHDAVSGTEKQHVANDYAKRLSIGSEASYEVLSDMTRVLVAKRESKPLFSHCPYLNISLCPILENLSKGKTVVVVVNNPLAWERTQWVHFPSPISSVNGIIIIETKKRNSTVIFNLIFKK